MIFTDSDGREYEQVPNGVQPSSGIVIRPVKQEPKYTVILADPYKGMGEVRVEFPYPDKDQAQAIKELVEKIMFGLNGSNIHYFDDTIRKAFDKARHLMGGK